MKKNETRVKALVVDDDERIVEVIEDVLFSIGHQYVWASNLHDARNMLSDEPDLGYVLLDLEFPAKPNRMASKENGQLLLEEIQQTKGYRQMPVIVMSGHWDYCLNRANRFREQGAYEFITKPFPTESHTLASVIRKVLKSHRREAKAVNGKPAAAAEPGKFAGGHLEFFDDRVELLGVKIISDRGTGLTIEVLRQLQRRDSNGSYARLSADDLSQAVGAMGGVNSITGCIRHLRRNITNRLRKHLNLDVGDDDVIGHDEQGYYLREWLDVREEGDGTTLDQPEPAASATSTADSTAAAKGDSDSATRLNDRQQWVLRELGRGVQLNRTMIEHRFDVGEKTAKRDLAALTRRGLVFFVRQGRNGYYQLCSQEK